MGEWVFLKLRPHRQQSVARRVNQKLAPRYYGPFPIVAKIGAVSYKLKLPNNAKIHPVFHISQLKKAIGDYTVEASLPVDLQVEEEEMEEPEEVLASRDILKQGQTTKQWLIKWKNRNLEDATWEDEGLLKSQFPFWRLEDKAVVIEGGNDRTTEHDGPIINTEEAKTARPKVWLVYSRRKKVGPKE